MKKLQTITTLFFILISSITFAQNSEEQAREVVETGIKAMGGKDFLKSINTLYTDSKTLMDGRDVNWVIKEMLPNKGSFEIVYQKRIVYKSWYDGNIGYELINGAKQKADPEQFKDKKYKKNIFNGLDYLDRNLYTLEYLGEEKVGELNCHKIKTKLANGKVENLYYDKAKGFLIKSETISNAEKHSFTVTLYEDYQKFGKLTHFTVMKFLDNGNTQIAKIIDLKYNTDISEKDFE